MRSFFLHVQGGGGDEGVNACAVGTFQRFGSAGNVTVVGAGEGTDRGILDGVRNRFHRFEISVGARRKTCLDDIHLQSLELARNAQFLVAGHGCTRRLLAIAQGGIENDQFVGHVSLLWFKIGALALPLTPAA